MLKRVTCTTVGGAQSGHLQQGLIRTPRGRLQTNCPATSAIVIWRLYTPIYNGASRGAAVDEQAGDGVRRPLLSESSFRDQRLGATTPRCRAIVSSKVPRGGRQQVTKGESIVRCRQMRREAGQFAICRFEHQAIEVMGTVGA